MAFADDVNVYCNTDDDLTGLTSAAETYLDNLGVYPDESNSLYALAVKMLVSWWYDQRVPSASSGNDNVQPFGLFGVIQSLKSAQGGG